MAELRHLSNGALIAGRYRIESTLEEAGERAFFLVQPEEPGARRALAEVLRAAAPGATAQLERWKIGATQSHPHLMRIFSAGREVIDGELIVYAVMEYPDEQLSAVLKERPLSPEETSQVASSLAGALAYLHRRGLVHGHVGAASVAAVEDAIKLSTDQLARPGEKTGSASDDVLALGILLHQALTQRAPSAGAGGRIELPDARQIGPLAEVLRGCLQPDPQKRWSADRIEQHLSGVVPEPEPAASAPAAAAFAAAVAPDAEPLAPAPPPVSDPPAPSRGGIRWWAYAGLGAGLVGLVLLLVALPRKQPVKPAAPVVSAQAVSPPPEVKPARVPRTVTPLPDQSRPSALSPERVASPAGVERRGHAARQVVEQPTQAPPPRQAASGATVWRVIVYTFNARAQAEHKAQTLNERYPGFNAEVFDPFGEKGPFLIAVGGRMNHDEAVALQRKARAQGLPKDTFVRNFTR
jgi:hypothetical protein